MKKSKLVNLVLITAALATANKTDAQNGGASGDWDKQPEKKVYMRSDTTAKYTRTHHTSGIGNAILRYYAFRPYGSSYGYGSYNRTGFYSRGLSSQSNIGSNPTKSAISRGGFGGRAFSSAS
ncbi:MAG: hypothetical protein U5L45_10105 [Saprospiraceae bacterium]|nr:hypothetical protein [Saprospiraceae bacterium]